MRELERRDKFHRLREQSYAAEQAELSGPERTQRQDAGYIPRVFAAKSSADDPAKHFLDVLEKDAPKVTPTTSNSTHGLTAASLISAIITHQIGLDTSDASPSSGSKAGEPLFKNNRCSPESSSSNIADGKASPYKGSRLLPSATKPLPSKEEVVTVEDDPIPRVPSTTGSHYDPSVSRGRTPQPSPGRDITFRKHIESIIMDDYGHSGPQEAKSMLRAQPVGPASRISPFTPPLCTDSRRSPMVPVSGSMPGLPMEGAQLASLPDDPASQAAYQSNCWKLRKALQQDKEAKEAASPSDNRSPNPNRGIMLAPDERQIIRIAQQPASPRPGEQKGMSRASPVPAYQVEPISPPDSNHSEASTAGISSSLLVHMSQSPWMSPALGRVYSVPDSSEAADAKSSGRPPAVGISPLDYVKNRIVEVMRTTSDGAADPQADLRPPIQAPSNQSHRVEERYRNPGESERPLADGSREMLIPTSQPYAPMYPPSQPRAPYPKRAMDIAEVSGSLERRESGRNRPRSISPSSSDVGVAEAEESTHKRIRLDHSAPESSSRTASPQLLLPESSDGPRAAGQLGSSSDPASDPGPVSSNSQRASPYPQSSCRDEDRNLVAESSTGGRPASWDNEASSAKDRKDADVSPSAADSPQSGEMVIDESVGLDVATSSKIEPVSPANQDNISTTQLNRERMEPASSSSSAADSASQSQAVTSTHSTSSTSLSERLSSPSSSGASYVTQFPSSSSIQGQGLAPFRSGVGPSCPFPFSALTVRASTSPVAPSPTPSHPLPQPSTMLSSRSNSPNSMSRENEPAPLMSSQYEPLSDED